MTTGMVTTSKIGLSAANPELITVEQLNSGKYRDFTIVDSRDSTSL
jgi:hypothetical protein